VHTYLNELYGVQACAAIGFKLMLSQCLSKPFIWPLIVGCGAKAILVTRRNVLKTLVSRRAAATSGVYHVSPSLPAKSAVANWVPRPAFIDPTTVIDDLDKIANEPLEWKRRLGGVEFVELIYEEYVQDLPRWNTVALDFLGVSRQLLGSDLRKVNPNDLQDVVSNYDQIAEIVRKSRYSYCLG
jgi:hypothetical protein